MDALLGVLGFVARSRIDGGKIPTDDQARADRPVERGLAVAFLGLQVVIVLTGLAFSVI